MAYNREKGCWRNDDVPPNYGGPVTIVQRIRLPRGEGERNPNRDEECCFTDEWDDEALAEKICEKFDLDKEYTPEEMSLCFGVELEQLIRSLDLISKRGGKK